MRELNIVAVGSNPLIAAEIQGLLQDILGNFFTVDTATTDSLQKAASDTFYICANTQGKKLQAVIPQKQLFIWELHPTTRFFLDIAKIPAGSDVYVFNNLLPYTELLAKECQALGIDKLNFHPLAYMEMPHEEICAQLGKARYIIGVECMMGQEALQSETFRTALQPDVTIIPGHRSATIQCVSQLLTAIAEFYLGKYANADDTKSHRETIMQVINTLKEAANRAVTSRLGINAPLPSFEETMTGGTLAEHQSMLNYLAKKLAHLSIN